MNAEKKALLAELRGYMKELKGHSEILNFLPKELKLIIKEASAQLKAEPAIVKENTEDFSELSSSMSDDVAVAKNDKKDICDTMLENWTKLIIEPYTEEATAMLNAGTASAATLQTLANSYFKKYSNKKWFDPQNALGRSNYMSYINVASINRNIQLQRMLQTDESGTLVEVGPLISGTISRSTTTPYNVGIGQTATIAIPSSKKNTLVLGGTFTYTLDSLTEPDTFTVSMGPTIVAQRVNNVGSFTGRGGFGIGTGDLIVDVQESANTSQWTVTILLSFLQVLFNIPACQLDIPCPEWKE